MLQYQDHRHEPDGAANMVQPQIIAGTTEEITARLQQTYAGQKLRVFVEPEEQTDLAHNQAQLQQILLEALDSPTHAVTDETFEQIRQEVRKRHAARQP